MEILGLVDVPLWLIFSVLLLVTLYNFATWTFGAFKGSILKGPKPIPVLGNNFQLFTKGIIQYHTDLIQEYGSTFAFFDGSRPMVITLDPDIIKTIFVKEFHNFPNRLSFTTGTEPTCLMLSVVEGDAWKRMRGLMSPTFSSGKLKMMTHQIHDCCMKVIDRFRTHAENGTPLAMKACTGAFTVDAIARTAFGLNLNPHEEENDPFVKMAKKATDFSIFSPAVLAFFFPILKPVLRLLDIDFLKRDVCNFFGDITDQIIEERKKSNVKQTDFLQLMLNAHEEEHEENDNADEAEKRIVGTKPKQALSHDELKAQAILFFIAGYDTTAATLTYLFYNLTVFPDTQDELHKEVMKHCEGKEVLDYSTLGEMTYLDLCIKETQRLYPALLRLDRVAVNDTIVKGIDIKKDFVVSVPVYALHHNPDVWPNPEDFKPERFADLTPEQAGSYMPFGSGPRNCIGMRLALLEIKMLVAQVIKHFHLIKCEETQFPMKLHKTKLMQPEIPIKIGIEKRR